MKNAMNYFLVITMLVPMSCITVNAQDKNSILGEWINKDKSRKIIFYEEPGGTYGAKISWLKDPDEGKVKVGDIIIRGLHDEKVQFSGGELYAPRFGGWVSGIARLHNDTTLEIKGTRGAMSKSQFWSRDN